MLPPSEISYLIKVLKSDPADWQDFDKMANLHMKCSFTAKTLVRLMIEGSTPICYQAFMYRKDSLEDLTRFLYRCLKLYQMKDDSKKILLLVLKLVHDPQADIRPLAA